MGVSMSWGCDSSLRGDQWDRPNVFVVCRHSWIGSAPPHGLLGPVKVQI